MTSHRSNIVRFERDPDLLLEAFNQIENGTHLPPFAKRHGTKQYRSPYLTINTKEKWIYTAAAKTGTTSIRRWLIGSTYIEYEILKELRKNIENPNHQSLHEFKKYIPDFKSYKKIVTVRNPFDRIASLFNERAMIYNKQTFKDFVLDMKYSSDYCEHSANLKYQYDWGYDDCIFIKLENIKESLHELSEIFNVKEENFTHHRKGKDKIINDYRSIYTQELIDHIYLNFNKDIEYFNYKF